MSFSPIKTNVVVAMGSTTVQGVRYDRNGKGHILFQDGITNPPGIKTKDTPENREHIKDFLYYLSRFVNPGMMVVIVNSAGYSLDGGKKKGDQIGIPYSLVDNIDNFADKSFMGIVSDIVMTAGNESLRGIFTVVNRNYKTSDGEEISGQWAKQIQSYLVSIGHTFTKCAPDNIGWMIDVGGKSATLYEKQTINQSGAKTVTIFTKKGTYFSDTSPNSLIVKPSDFQDALSVELQKMVTDHSIDLKATVILQTGDARDKCVLADIISSDVAYHGFLPPAIESEYEALDFNRTVIKSDISTGCVFTPSASGVITVKNIPVAGMCSIM
jgi:hypothetical protein